MMPECAKPMSKIVKMTPEQLEKYFMANARYLPDSKRSPYTIRLGTGSNSLFSDDTYDLRLKFEEAVKAEAQKGLIALGRGKKG